MKPDLLRMLDDEALAVAITKLTRTVRGLERGAASRKLIDSYRAALCEAESEMGRRGRGGSMSGSTR
jgi:hypothetical protein